MPSPSRRAFNAGLIAAAGAAVLPARSVLAQGDIAPRPFTVDIPQADLDRIPFTMDQVLTDIMIYLVTDSIDTSAWFFRGYLEDQPAAPGRGVPPPITVPTAKVSLPKESPPLDAPQSLIARYYNLVRYTRLPRGGHFAFWEQPQPMAADVRDFFRTLRG